MAFFSYVAFGQRPANAIRIHFGCVLIVQKRAERVIVEVCLINNF